MQADEIRFLFAYDRWATRRVLTVLVDIQQLDPVVGRLVSVGRGNRRTATKRPDRDSLEHQLRVVGEAVHHRSEVPAANPGVKPCDMVGK